MWATQWRLAARRSSEFSKLHLKSACSEEINDGGGGALCASYDEADVKKQMTRLDPALPTGLFLAASCARLFTFHFENITFAAARERCQKDHTDLAVVRNAEDLSELNSAMRQPIAWIGLRADTASWRWSEANVVVRPQPRLSESAGVQFTNWESGKPGDALHQSCAAVNSRGKWMDENCQEMYSFICYRGKNK